MLTCGLPHAPRRSSSPVRGRDRRLRRRAGQTARRGSTGTAPPRHHTGRSVRLSPAERAHRRRTAPVCRLIQRDMPREVPAEEHSKPQPPDPSTSPGFSSRSGSGWRQRDAHACPTLPPQEGGRRGAARAAHPSPVRSGRSHRCDPSGHVPDEAHVRGAAIASEMAGLFQPGSMSGGAGRGDEVTVAWRGPTGRCRRAWRSFAS